jgi:hypothetical protein
VSNHLSKSLIAALCVIGLSAFETETAAQSTAREIRGWGRFEDPSGQAKLRVENSSVTVTSGKNEMTAKDTLGRMPRIVREVTDDFDVRVHVSGEFTAEYQNAVLLAFANPDEYARMSCGSGRYRTKQVSTGFMARGVIAGGRHHRTKDTSKWLRMQRVDGAIRCYYSHDGKKWHASASSQEIKFKDGGGARFAQPMQLMLMVHNRGAEPLTVRFEHFEMVEGEDMEAIAVVDDKDDPLARFLKQFGTSQPRPVPGTDSRTTEEEETKGLDESRNSHEQLTEQTLDALAKMIDAVGSSLTGKSEVTQQQIEALVKRADKLRKTIKELPPQSYEQRSALLERVDEHHDQLQRKIEGHQQKFQQIVQQDPDSKADPEVEQKSRERIRIIWRGLVGSKELALRAGIPFTEERAVLVNPRRVLVAPAGDIAIEMVLLRYRAEPNTPIYGGKEGRRLNPRHQLIERKTRFVTARPETATAMIRSLNKADSADITRLPIAGARFVDPGKESHLWTLISNDLLAPGTTRQDLPAAFGKASEYEPSAVTYDYDGKKVQLSFAGVMAWLFPDAGNSDQQQAVNNLRDLIAADKIDEAVVLLASTRAQHPQSARLARLGLSVADAYRRGRQLENAQAARADSISYLLSMPEDTIARSVTILQALLTNQLLHAQDDESIRQASAMFDRATESLRSNPREQSALSTAKALTLASVGRGKQAEKLIDAQIAVARKEWEERKSTANRLALAKLLVAKAELNRQLDQSPLKPLAEAANLLAHEWAVQQVNDLDAIRQYLVTYRTLAITSRKSVPRIAYEHVNEVYRTLSALQKKVRKPIIRTLIESEQQELAMLLTGLKSELGNR